MNNLQERLETVTDIAANLISQLNELNQLRDQLRKVQLSVRRTVAASFMQTPSSVSVGAPSLTTVQPLRLPSAARTAACTSMACLRVV